MNAPQRVGTIDRAEYIGGSAISAILGVNPFRTRLQLYLEIIGEVKEVVDAEKARFFKRRKRQEPIVAETLAEDNGYDVIRLSTDADPNRYRDEQVPYFAAEVDFELRVNSYLLRDHPVLAALPEDTVLNGEIKTVHPLNVRDFGEDGSDIVPDYYTAQVLWGLGVTGRPAALLAALIGVDELRCYPILRDEETIAWMREEARRFWEEHVVPRVPPPPTTLEDAKQMFRRFNGRPCELDDAAFAALKTVEACRATVRAAKEEQEAAETTLALAIAKDWQLEGPDQTADNAVLRYQGIDVATWKLTRGSYLDQKTLKVEHPELVPQYTVTHFYRAFRIKAAK